MILTSHSNIRRTIRHAAAFLFVAGLAAAEGLTPESRERFERDVQPFLENHCYRCHDERRARAGLRLDELGTDFLTGKTADFWHEVANSIGSGEMPPEERQRPDAAEAFRVVEWIGEELRTAEKNAKMAGGRVLSRRLNREEYLNTVHDLLHLDQHFVETLREDLPGDGKAEGFDRLGAALLFDATQLTSYIGLGGKIAETAIVGSGEPPAVDSLRVELEDIWRANDRPEEIIQYQKDTRIPYGPDHTVKREDGVLSVQAHSFDRTGYGIFSPGLKQGLRKFQVPRDGFYRIRLRAGADVGTRGEPVRIRFTYFDRTPIQTVAEHVVHGTLDQPEELEVTMFLRQPPDGKGADLNITWNGVQNSVIMNPELAKSKNARNRANNNLSNLIAEKADPKEIEAAKVEVAAAIEAARKLSQSGIEARIWNPKYQNEQLPRLFLDWVEVSGPLEKEWPPASHASLFPDGVKADPAGLREWMHRFLPRAFRRFVPSAEVEHFVNATTEASARFKLDEVGTARYALQLVLSSPEFLMLFEPSEKGAPKRPINDFELASRLSYFLWSTMPDMELFRLAFADELSEPEELQRQVRRMIADPKARAFAENFAGQWLHVRDYESVTPARDYKEYDAALRQAGAEEPIAFFEEILRNDLPVLNFLDSDFTMANDRLAKFYGIEGVEGSDFRRVLLDASVNRGGVLTMAGLLTYLADGTRTLPVRRGAWILEEMFNSPPPPPPPNAGEIQPNTAGKRLTVRERLELHRSEPTCASCHAKIDPLGLALENYDAIGAWRERQNGEEFRGGNTPPIDAAGTLPSGRSFTTPGEFKQALLAEKERFAAAFTQKMLTYAIGRPVGYTDRETVEEITRLLEKDDYKMQSLIMGAVTSDPFLTK